MENPITSVGTAHGLVTSHSRPATSSSIFVLRRSAWDCAPPINVGADCLFFPGRGLWRLQGDGVIGSLGS